MSLLDAMIQNSVQPDQYSYNSAIAGCVKARQPQAMAAVLARMREAGFSPDIVTHSNLMKVSTHSSVISVFCMTRSAVIGV